MRTDAPVGLLHAMEKSIANDIPMRQEHVEGTADWLHEFIAMNVDDPVTFTIDEVHLLAKALSSGLHYMKHYAKGGGPT